ncbi:MULTISPECIES: hypothetical protein [unclassified Streptomyces]|uniref:hypothetical protein n=1 Tax=unclassified Streptomyces TaxID=2593676 RepID=UPI001661E2C6|nr:MULTISPECIES: hypothetical protein [unclassified Streptomyces]MBD0842584.1 hypothetical protein [Streptomyces sp. TRM68416]
MGIRLLHRRTAPAEPHAGARPDAAAAPPLRVPAFAAAASTARVPADLRTTLRRTATALRRARLRVAARRRLWTEVGRGCLDLVLARLPRPDRTRTVTVFVSAPPEPAPRNGPAPQEPDATP